MRIKDPYAKTRKEAERLYKKLYGKPSKPKSNKYVGVKTNPGNIKPKISEVEDSIKRFLESERVKFYQQYKIAIEIKGIKKTLFCDFYLPEYGLIIEYRGLHHFKAVYGQEMLKNTRRSDAYKVIWARKNKKHLLVITFSNKSEYEFLICSKLDKIAPNT